MTATLSPAPLAEAPLTEAPTTPDLSIFFWLHRAMRRDSRRLVATLDGAVSLRRARGLVRWFERFQQVLEHHHAIEDEFFWPALVAADPAADEVTEAMIAEHHQLDQALARTRDALAVLATSGADADRRGAHTAACGLRDILATHLDHEEGDTLPRFAAMPVDEYDALHERAVKSAPMRVSALMAPFVVRYLDDDEFAQLRAKAPAILFVLNRWVWGPQDARITRVLVPAA
jgi:hemerythrin-like domain-containing protein